MVIKRIVVIAFCAVILTACSESKPEQMSEVTGEVQSVKCRAYGTAVSCELTLKDGRLFRGGGELRDINEGISIVMTVHGFNDIRKVRYAEVTE